jgi:uncharacterized oxidoreductase
LIGEKENELKMKLTGNTILITGGSNGIGLALAERFLEKGNTVIVCGRRLEKLNEAKANLPNLHTIVADMGIKEGRVSLYEEVKKNFPDLNVLINNAGIQQRVNFAEELPSWEYMQNEIAINVDGPIHLSALFIPLLKEKQESYIINITSGLAIAHAAWVPIYSATKAAIHSFTMSLRFQLSQTPVKVIEVAPPAVNTDLGGPGLHTFGVPVRDFADAVMTNLEKGEEEFGYGTSEQMRNASRQQINETFERMNKR